MAKFIYSLCAVTSLSCAFLLFIQYYRRHHKLLMWSAVCFLGFALNNILLFVDLIIIPNGPDLSQVRILPSALGVTFLIVCLVRQAEI